MSARVAALVGLIVLGGALVVVIAVTTPWRPLPGDVPGGAVTAAPARDFTTEEIAHEDAFHGDVRPPAYASMLVSLALALVLGLTTWGARIVERVAAPLGGGWVWQILLGGIAISLLGRLIVLPLNMRAEVVLRKYGLSTQSWGSWLVDVTKGFLLSTGLLLLVLFGFYALVRAMPQWWWAPAAGAAAALVIVVSFVYPLVVEPVFNKFTPMADGPLRTSLLELADKDGIPVNDVLVADASRRTTAVNAYVSGFGSTRRIVVYDTLIDTATEAEVRSVVAHELGHAKRHDVLHGTLVGALGAAAGVCLLYLALTWPALLRRAGVSTLADPRSLALVMAVIAVLTLVGGPLQLLVSRRIETRADVHALDLTRDPDSFAAMQRRLALSNLSDVDPSPLVFGLFASHPTAPQRIALARDWARQHDVHEPADLATAGSTP